MIANAGGKFPCEGDHGGLTLIGFTYVEAERPELRLDLSGNDLGRPAPVGFPL